MAERNERHDVDVLERGRIYFLYRPAVEEATPSGVVDLQRLFLVLHPEGEERRRLLVVGHKKLPDVHGGSQKFWGFVDQVAESAEDLAETLAWSEHDPETGSARPQAAARPAGEGDYALVRHGDHAHLAYKLAVPASPGEVQSALNIAAEASYVLSVKNPEASSPQGIGLDRSRRAEFPKALQERFGDRRFIPLDAPAFLDHEGAEILLMAPHEDVEAELGLELEAHDSPEVFDDLSIEKTERATEPLKGHWA